MNNFKADLNIVLEAVRKASIKITKDFYEIEKLQISKKGVANFVTSSDIAAEKTLINYLQKSRPQYCFLTEESGFIPALQENNNNDGIKYQWIIDPIDGTSNFMHGLPYFCISVGLAKIGKFESSIILGVIHNPIVNETFWAVKRNGAFLIDSLGIQRKMKVSPNNDYEQLICAIQENCISHHKLKNYQNYIQSKYVKQRIFGASALELAYLADGRINLLIQGKLNLWDYAAGLILVKEAGGVVRDLNLKDLDLNMQDGIIAGNKTLLNDIEKNC